MWWTWDSPKYISSLFSSYMSRGINLHNLIYLILLLSTKMLTSLPQIFLQDTGALTFLLRFIVNGTFQVKLNVHSTRVWQGKLFPWNPSLGGCWSYTGSTNDGHPKRHRLLLQPSTFKAVWKTMTFSEACINFIEFIWSFNMRGQYWSEYTLLVSYIET